METTERTPVATRTATFFFEDTTPNTVKFEEVPARGQAPMSGRLYLKKYVVEGMAAELGVDTLHGVEVTIRGIAAPATAEQA